VYSCCAGDNVHGITQLAYKYEVGDVLKQCEQYLIDNGQASVDKLVLAQDCHLPHLFEHCLTDASSSLRLSDVIADAKFPSLSEDTVLLLLQKRLALFEMLFEGELKFCLHCIVFARLPIASLAFLATFLCMLKNSCECKAYN
jgi:hypothetical protein